VTPERTPPGDPEQAMAIDNEMYDRLSHTWWDEDAFLTS
jgi:hypothetical protein